MGNGWDNKKGNIWFILSIPSKFFVSHTSYHLFVCMYWTKYVKQLDVWGMKSLILWYDHHIFESTHTPHLFLIKFNLCDISDSGRYRIYWISSPIKIYEHVVSQRRDVGFFSYTSTGFTIQTKYPDQNPRPPTLNNYLQPSTNYPGLNSIVYQSIDTLEDTSTLGLIQMMNSFWTMQRF